MKRLLHRAIAEGLNFSFETTLGGSTIASLLMKATTMEIDVNIWYVGLVSPELHIARVRSRVARGGHDIPEERIRKRYYRSISNLIELMPKLNELRVYDNSTEADPHAGIRPQPLLILHVIQRRIVETCQLERTPKWAKPIVMSAFRPM